MDKALIIDGNAVIYKAYFASQANAIKQNKSDDEITKEINKTIRFVSNICNSLLTKKEYQYATVVFDSSRKTFRQEKFSEYKANRSPMPTPLLNVLPPIKEVLWNLGFVVVNAPKCYEGDDVICTLAKIFNDNGIQAEVFSTDKDLLQLVSPNTTVTLFRAKGEDPKQYNYEDFFNLTKGLMPYQIPQLKAIAGDASDNYSGLPGVGDKTARDLLSKYSSIENIYENLDSLNPKLREKFATHKELLFLFLELATTVSNVDISKDINKYKRR
ncbi:DNA polymerase I [Candidatus Mycoplasma haematobovis]|uniref:5'-3' exonuclease n=1 Tax=Candidatus Mycoplasma haematobovis TaxID=432608 RepID=A0A1A9QDX8_9MOLU|nr:5'-3' exonuclease [Candidatus Mycoplasma haematobovis]OAL10201.1 DNA polymerase I [Candidatus Mycoplasma haematobovis]